MATSAPVRLVDSERLENQTVALLISEPSTESPVVTFDCPRNSVPMRPLLDEVLRSAVETVYMFIVSNAPTPGASWNEIFVTDRKRAEIISELRRKIAAFSRLGANWDGENAEPIAPASVKTAQQVVEHIGILLDRKNTTSGPSILAFPDGSIFVKWIHDQKELAITIHEDKIEAQRWQPLDAFNSLGLWEIIIDEVPEHIEWVLT